VGKKNRLNQHFYDGLLMLEKNDERINGPILRQIAEELAKKWV
jgi:hypothetical protein